MTTSILGQTVSHYRVIEPLGEGGMGVVYRAEDIKLGRPVALKFLGPGRAHDRQMLERFLREARTASALNHPNICTIYEIDEHEGAPFIAMELLEGQTLDRKIDGRPLSITQLIDYGIQICDALEAAHSRGVLHRDIKPANIFVNAREQIKVLDFGLAKSTEPRLSGDARSDAVTELMSTRAGVALGTIAYMSPEQARGEELDARSDLFSFGLVLYEMTTGQRTFQGNTSAVVFDAILNHEPPAPVELNANVPLALERIIARLLDKDPHRRYQGASEIRRELVQVKEERSASGARTVSRPVTASQRSGAHWPSAVSTRRATGRPGNRTTLVTIAGAVVAGSVALGAWLSLRPSPPPAEGGTPSAAMSDLEDVVSEPLVDPAADDQTTSAETPVAAAGPAAAGPTTTSTVPAGTPAARESRRAATNAAAAPAPAPVPAAQPVADAVADVESPALDPLAEQIGVARAKLDAKLYDQAIADVKAGLAAAPGSAAAPAGRLLLGQILQQQGRVEDAMAAYVELRSRHASSSEAVDGTFLLTDLVLQSKRGDRDETARRLLSEIPSMSGAGSRGVQALVRRAALEDRARFRVADSTLGTVPASLLTHRQIAESYPDSPAVEASLARLAEMYEDLRRYELAGQAWLDLARKFPGHGRDPAWKAGELFERRVRDPQRAREAYALVPPRSPRYRDAQKKLQP